MSATIASNSACISHRMPTRSCTRSPALTIRSSAGVGRTKRGRSWKRSPRSAGRTGSALAIATLRFMSSAPVGCSGARLSPPSPPTSVAASASVPACCRRPTTGCGPACELAGVLVVTIDPAAASLAARYGARIVTEGAREGHTGAVTAAARLLVREGWAGMMTMPGDIPRLSPAEIAATLAAHRAAPAFTIVPAHDDLGSNMIVCSPPDAVSLRFGEDSFYPHLDAARDRGIDPLIVRHPGIGMDIDHPVDLISFLRMSPPVPTRTLAFLEQSGIAGRLLAANQDLR